MFEIIFICNFLNFFIEISPVHFERPYTKIYANRYIHKTIQHLLFLYQNIDFQNNNNKQACKDNW